MPEVRRDGAREAAAGMGRREVVARIGIEIDDGRDTAERIIDCQSAARGDEFQL